MREFLLKNKGKIIRVSLLLVVFFIVTAYINGRNIYKQKTQDLNVVNTTTVR